MGLLLRMSVLATVTAMHAALFAWALYRPSQPFVPAQAQSVMLSTSEETLSVALLIEVPVGPMQQATLAQASAALPEPVAPMPQASDEELVASPEPAIAVQRPVSPRTRPGRSSSSATQRQAATHRSAASAALSASAPPPGQAASVSARDDSRSASIGHAADWRARVLAYLAWQQGYPASAMAARLEGRLVARVTIDRQGKVLSVQLQRSSGHAVLDQHALRAIQRRSPLPAPPEDLLADLAALHLNIPVEFNLRKYRSSLSAAPVHLPRSDNRH